MEGVVVSYELFNSHRGIVRARVRLAELELELQDLDLSMRWMI